MRPVIVVLGLIGLGLAIGLIVWQGVGPVIQATLAIGWGLVAVIAWHAIPLSIDATAWGLLLPSGSRLPFITLLRLRWIRQSVSHLLPVAHIGGDAVGARMMHLAGVRGDLAGAAVVVDLTLIVGTQVLFTLIGLALFGTYSGADDLTWPLLIVAGALLVGIAGFVFAQRNGLFHFLVKRANGLSGGLVGLVGDAKRLDDSVRLVHRRTGDIARNAILQLVSWFSGAAEVWIACYYLGYPISAADAVILQSLSRAVRAAAFIVPGGLGVQEGGIFVLATVIGLPPEIGLALALVKRVRELVIGAPGLIAWQAAEGHHLWRRHRAARRG